MIENLDKALSLAQEVLASPESVRRICISGRAKGKQPEQVRIDIRPVVLKAGLHWQVVSHDGKRDSYLRSASRARRGKWTRSC